MTPDISTPETTESKPLEAVIYIKIRMPAALIPPGGSPFIPGTPFLIATQAVEDAINHKLATYSISQACNGGGLEVRDSQFILLFTEAADIVDIYPDVQLDLIKATLIEFDLLKFTSVWYWDAGDIAWRASNRGVGFENECFDLAKFATECQAHLAELKEMRARMIAGEIGAI